MYCGRQTDGSRSQESLEGIKYRPRHSGRRLKEKRWTKCTKPETEVDNTPLIVDEMVIATSMERLLVVVTQKAGRERGLQTFNERIKIEIPIG